MPTGTRLICTTSANVLINMYRPMRFINAPVDQRLFMIQNPRQRLEVEDVYVSTMSGRQPYKLIRGQERCDASTLISSLAQHFNMHSSILSTKLHYRTFATVLMYWWASIGQTLKQCHDGICQWPVRTFRSSFVTKA